MDAIPKSSLGGLRYIPPQVVQVKSVGNGGIPVKLCGPLKQPPGRREVGVVRSAGPLSGSRPTTGRQARGASGRGVWKVVQALRLLRKQVVGWRVAHASCNLNRVTTRTVVYTSDSGFLNSESRR
jgi:hypothetical protein